MSSSIKHTAAIADYVLKHGIAEASLRPMAKAAGTSDRMLLYHYDSKSGVIDAALREIVRRNIDMLESALPEDQIPADRLMEVIGLAMTNGLFDLSLAVFFELASRAQRGDPIAKEIGLAIAQHFRDWIATRLTEPERAVELLAAVEGWGVLNAVGLDVPFPKG